MNDKPNGKGERVLDLWATTTKTKQEIAAEAGTQIGSVYAFMSTARRRGDTRIAQGESLRAHAANV